MCYLAIKKFSNVNLLFRSRFYVYKTTAPGLLLLIFIHWSHLSFPLCPENIDLNPDSFFASNNPINSCNIPVKANIGKTHPSSSRFEFHVDLSFNNNPRIQSRKIPAEMCLSSLMYTF